MYQKDYILRMIEMIGRMIAGILGKIKNKDYDAADEQLTNLYYDVLKEDASFFRKIPMDQLTEKLLREHNYTNGHLEILAELFNVESELEFARGQIKESLEYSKKALLLFEFIDREMKTYSIERINKMEALRVRLDATPPAL